MTANFILGIGGTGAKCIEAFTRLTFCGLGPISAWVGLLDQDRSNGNAARTQRVLQSMVDLRAAFRASGANDLGPNCNLLRTAIERPAAGWAWAPEEKASASLATSIGYAGLPPAEAALAEALFSSEERRLQLDEGFRQRPALGAALTLQGVTPASQVWRDLLGALQAAGQGEEVRVFLVASIFGGTGASGFPTVARLLRNAIQERGLTGRVLLGGALMLPYFAFPTPPVDEGLEIRPDSSSFLNQARGALEYYANLFGREAVFDRLYLVGSDPLIPIGAYSDGGSLQSNPPLMPELVGALAALNFLTVYKGSDRETVAAGTGNDEAVSWDDLPYNGQAGYLRTVIGAALRTATAWRAQYAPALRGDNWKRHATEAWFRRHLMGGAGQAVAADPAQHAIELLTRASDDLLRWFVALNRAGAGGGRRAALVADDVLAREWSSESMTDIPLVSTNDNSSFRRLVPPSGPSLSDVFARLTYGPTVPGGAGPARFVAALHSACQEDRRTGA